MRVWLLCALSLLLFFGVLYVRAVRHGREATVRAETAEAFAESLAAQLRACEAEIDRMDARRP